MGGGAWVDPRQLRTLSVDLGFGMSTGRAANADVVIAVGGELAGNAPAKVDRFDDHLLTIEATARAYPL